MDNNVEWRGTDASLSVCINDYGMVYQFDGEDFNGWIVDEVDEDGNPISFAPFWMDTNVIDDYFADNGNDIASMCGTTPDEMDYEWKMDALIAYYGSYEFKDGMYKPKSVEELVELVKDNWVGYMDM